MLDAEYNATVMEHFLNPRNVGELKDASAIGIAVNPHCGDTMKLYIKVADGRIADLRFKTFGCGAAIASSSIGTELFRGKTIDEALSVTDAEIVSSLGGLPERKVVCSLLAVKALAAAVDEFRRRSK